jgi:hypothetical protein
MVDSVAADPVDLIRVGPILSNLSVNFGRVD